MLSANENYRALLSSIKEQVVNHQHKAAMAVNSRLLFAYWNIGHHILREQENHGWGAKVIEQLAKDLSAHFTESKGFSKRNLTYMRQFASEWTAEFIAQHPAAQLNVNAPSPITQQGAAQIHLPFEVFEQHPISRVPWSTQMVLLDKLTSAQERLFYCQKIIEGNWSRKTVLNQLDRQLHLAQGALTHNFETTLPAPQSELAQDTFKDPYIFGFLQLDERAKEKEIEDQLVQQITDFLLELGAGFAYMGRQYKLEVGGQEYFLDLLFYHTKLRCYVTIELKIGEFKPEYAGKVQFYLTAIDELIKSPEDEPSIGLILCKESNQIIAEYALKDVNKPIGVANYELVNALPDRLKKQLPSIQEIEESLTQKQQP